jgi:hypothetical protein
MSIISHVLYDGCSMGGRGVLLFVHLNIFKEALWGCGFDSNFIEVPFLFGLVKIFFSRGRTMLCLDEGVGLTPCVLMKLH